MSWSTVPDFIAGVMELVNRTTHMSRPTIIATYWFDSSSGSGTYETLAYADRTTSCSCMGWTRRVDKDGHRSCKHTRMIDAGIAHHHAKAVTGTTWVPITPIQKTGVNHAKERKEGKHKPIKLPAVGQRKFFTE